VMAIYRCESVMSRVFLMYEKRPAMVHAKNPAFGVRYNRLPTERMRSISRGSLRIVSGLARTQTQSSVPALQGPKRQMDVWFCGVQKPCREAHCACRTS
jgi:hypothetical protein